MKIMSITKRMDTEYDRKKVSEILEELLKAAVLPDDISDYIREIVRNAMASGDDSKKASAASGDDGNDIHELVRSFLNEFQIERITDDYKYDDRDYTDVRIQLRHKDNYLVTIVLRLSELLEFENYVKKITLVSEVNKEISDKIWDFFLYHRSKEHEKDIDDIIQKFGS